ncbi:MAG: ribonuclease Y [Candidatus Paceibacterota bacterium]|jgi:ribonuclease Y
MIITPVLTVGVAILAFGVGYLISLWFGKKTRAVSDASVKAEIEAAETKTKEIIVEAKAKAALIVEDAQKEERERKNELRRIEERLEKKDDALQVERTAVDRDMRKTREEMEQVKVLQVELHGAHEKITKELEHVASLTREEAKQQIIKKSEEDYKQEIGGVVARLERDRRDEIEKKSTEIITSAIQRYARECINDVTTSVVPIQNEEIKGKIIGREGRNIRAFERLTGVEIIVDESPESIVISSFDPLRREHARLALEKLIKDGRIQPAKIEEKIEEARRELDECVRKAGEDAAYEVGILDLPKEIIPVLGRLNYRTSYGQNVLQHSIEMTYIAGMIATELHLNVAVVKKAALLHDIGKAMDHELEGTHVELGRKLLKKYGIEEAVIKAMEAHHEEYPFSSPESYIVAAADAISAARPGARRETLEKYLRRLEEIETVVNGFDGVRQSYAISAGREVRVFVTPEKVDDFGALQLAKQIAGKLKSDVKFPGEIKVTVIREVKAVEIAR